MLWKPGSSTFIECSLPRQSLQDFMKQLWVPSYCKRGKGDRKFKNIKKKLSSWWRGNAFITVKYFVAARNELIEVD